jgi:hypothetical protein
MADEHSGSAMTEPVAAADRSPRELMDAIVELLRLEHASTTDFDKLLDQLADGMDQCVGAQEEESIYDDAVQRAPWLTADAERLKQQQTALRESLQALRMLSRRGSGSGESLARRFDEFVELYAEHDAAEQDFFQAAYPGPDWAVQS